MGIHSMRQARWKIEFYTKRNGRCLLDKFLNSLSPRDRVLVNNAIKRLEEHGLDLSRPYVGYLRDHIRELRVRTHHGHYRLLHFIFDGNKFIMLQGITKKTKKVPNSEIEKAIEYRNDYLARNIKR